MDVIERRKNVDKLIKDLIDSMIEIVDESDALVLSGLDVAVYLSAVSSEKQNIQEECDRYKEQWMELTQENNNLRMELEQAHIELAKEKSRPSKIILGNVPITSEINYEINDWPEENEISKEILDEIHNEMRFPPKENPMKQYVWIAMQDSSDNYGGLSDYVIFKTKEAAMKYAEDVERKTWENNNARYNRSGLVYNHPEWIKEDSEGYSWRLGLSTYWVINREEVHTDV